MHVGSSEELKLVPFILQQNLFNLASCQLDKISTLIGYSQNCSAGGHIYGRLGTIIHPASHRHAWCVG
jgi:hypothetical protein